MADIAVLVEPQQGSVLPEERPRTLGTAKTRPVTQAAVEDKAELPIRAVIVGGGIGVGKSTLVQDAINKGLVGARERMNSPMLGDYVAAPDDLAFTLQVAAMHAACIRTQTALALATDATDRLMIVERGAQENIIFAVANHRRGYMDDREYRTYVKYIKFELESNARLLADAKTVQLLLHASEGEQIRRMIERGNLSEQAYEDEYMEFAADSYFRATLESIYSRHVPAWYRLQPFIVLDWSNFGNWESVAKLLQERPNLVAEFVAREPIRFVVDHPHARYAHPVWEEEEEVGQTWVHMDLAWYEGASLKTHARQRSVFRDAFFDALSKGRTVVFHGKQTVPTSLENHLVVYHDDEEEEEEEKDKQV